MVFPPFSCYWSNWPELTLPALPYMCVTSSGSPSGSSLLYRVQVLLESAGHAGDQVDVVVHAAAHAAVHQRANGRLLGARVEEILRLVVAVHRAPGEAILREKTEESEEAAREIWKTPLSWSWEKNFLP